MWLFGLLSRRKVAFAINIINFLSTFAGVVYRFYDFNDFQLTASLIFIFIFALTGYAFFVFCYLSIRDIEDNEKQKILEKLKQANLI